VVVWTPYIRDLLSRLIKQALFKANKLVNQVFASTIFGGYIFLSPLILALAYIFAQDNPNSNVTIFILSFPAKYLPYALVALTLLSSSPDQAWAQLAGLLAGHLYDFLTRIWPTFGGGRNYLATPTFVKRWYLQMATRETRRDYGTSIDNRTQNAVPPRNPGWQDNRGPGRRLGD
jgi:Derlin-2/3